MTPAALTEYLHHNIPLTQALELRVVRCEPGHVELAAPLSPNRNHHGTAFGGSLALLGIVCGWTVVDVALREAQTAARLMIQKSECEFLAQVTGDLQARARLDAQAWDHFTEAFARRNRARIAVTSEIVADGKPVFIHHGVYVALA